MRWSRQEKKRKGDKTRMGQDAHENGDSRNIDRVEREGKVHPKDIPYRAISAVLCH